MRALAHHRPMLIIPHGRDQDENAVRVTERGAGLKLAATANAKEIEIAVRRLLEDASFTKAAKRLGTVISDRTQDACAEELLEEMAAPPALVPHDELLAGRQA
jgi:UDP:flavonoid glycosyltransferase YjiC (YdhE family)